MRDCVSCMSQHRDTEPQRNISSNTRTLTRRRDAKTQRNCFSNTEALCLCVSVLKLCIFFLFVSAPVFAQQPAMERVTFEEAITRALANNPTIAGAAEAVLRAEGLLQQARAATRPGVNAFLTNSTLDTGRSF